MLIATLIVVDSSTCGGAIYLDGGTGLHLSTFQLNISNGVGCLRSYCDMMHQMAQVELRVGRVQAPNRHRRP